MRRMKYQGRTLLEATIATGAAGAAGEETVTRSETHTLKSAMRGEQLDATQLPNRSRSDAEVEQLVQLVEPAAEQVEQEESHVMQLDVSVS